MSDQKTFVTKTDGSGQSVTVSLGDGWRQFQVIIIALIVALCFSCTLALVAYIEAENAQYEASRWSMWGQRLEANLLAAGFKVPPDPDSKKADR